MNYKESVKRYEDIISFRNEGKTFQQIGDIYGVTRQAIEIRIKKGFPKESGGIFKHGLANKFQGRELVREQVRIRDNHTCQDCGKFQLKTESSRSLDVHHLNGLCGKKSRGYDKVSEMDGLITLCHKCHYNRPEHRCKTKEFGESVKKGWSLTK